jgi:hypothetical protein
MVLKVLIYKSIFNQYLVRIHHFEIKKIRKKYDKIFELQQTKKVLNFKQIKTF